MPRELNGLTLELTPVRRIKDVKITTTWDDATASTRVAVEFSYEVVYLDEDGRQILPPQTLKSVVLNDAECRAVTGFPTVYGIISSLGHDLYEAREVAENTAPGNPEGELPVV
jgi:hypothetical protein